MSRSCYMCQLPLQRSLRCMLVTGNSCLATCITGVLTLPLAGADRYHKRAPNRVRRTPSVLKSCRITWQCFLCHSPRRRVRSLPYSWAASLTWNYTGGQRPTCPAIVVSPAAKAIAQEGQARPARGSCPPWRRVRSAAGIVTAATSSHGTAAAATARGIPRACVPALLTVAARTGRCRCEP